jgi:hypothetical protein
MIEGSGSWARRPKNIRIRIRIRNTARNKFNCTSALFFCNCVMLKLHQQYRLIWKKNQVRCPLPFAPPPTTPSPSLFDRDLGRRIPSTFLLENLMVNTPKRKDWWWRQLNTLPIKMWPVGKRDEGGIPPFKFDFFTQCLAADTRYPTQQVTPAHGGEPSLTV